MSELMEKIAAIQSTFSANEQLKSDYAKIKDDVGMEAWTPSTQIMCFIIFGFFFSMCIVCCYLSMIYENVSDAFKDNNDDLEDLNSYARASRVEKL